jgi:hypothetical protein
MAITMKASTTNARGEDVAAEIARPLQDLKKCKYCNYEHWDDLNLRVHEEMHKEYCEEKEIKRQKYREYEMMLMRRFNLKKEIGLLQRSFTANEANIRDYESDEDTREFAHEVRERVWENRARKNWRSDTSFVNEHLELGYYVLTDRERELAAAAASSLHL